MRAVHVELHHAMAIAQIYPFIAGFTLLCFAQACDDAAPDKSTKNTGASAKPAGAQAAPVAKPDAKPAAVEPKPTPSPDAKGSVKTAACKALASTCKAKDIAFESKDWKSGTAGFITLETDALDTVLFAWTAKGEDVSVRLVAQVHDGSGASVNNLVKLDDVAVDDAERGTLSAKITLSSTDQDPGSCSTTSDSDTHLVVCANAGEFLCGGLQIAAESTAESDAACCKKESIPAADCPSTPTQSSQKSSVAFANGSWTVAGAKTEGTVDKDQRVELAAKGDYSAQAFTNTFTLPAEGLGL